MSSEKNDSIPNQHGPFLITFSGIDGAGKTTQIERLSSRFEKQGLRVLQLSFWDDVVIWPQMRSGVGQRAASFYRSDQTANESFEPRNYKHIRKWYLSVARAALYILDIVQLKRLLNTERVHNSDVVIFDRYVYDQLANIYSGSAAARTYLRMLLKLTPNPDLAFILDAFPQDAFARKPEYPLEFIYKNRAAFLELCKLSPKLITITAGNAEDVEEQIRTHIRQSRLTRATSAGKTETGGKVPVVLPKNSCKGENAPTAKV